MPQYYAYSGLIDFNYICYLASCNISTGFVNSADENAEYVPLLD